MKAMMPKMGTRRTMAMRRGAMMMAMPGRHEMMLRRAANHNVHVITHHGKVQIGRKGRTT